MSVAIIGAGGFIGQCLAARLRKSGVKVVSFSSRSINIFEPDTGVLSEGVDLPCGTECVVYLAQSPFYRQVPEKAAHVWGVNVISAIKIAELARGAGVRRFIYATTGNVYSPSFLPLKEESPVRRDNWYALSKLHAEEALALFKNDMSVTLARIFGVYGPGQLDKLIPNLVKSIRSGAPITLAPNPNNELDAGGLKVSLCYIDDIVEIFTQLINQTTAGIINIAGPEALSVRNIVQEIGDQLGISPQFEIANQPRQFDLVADVTKLVEMYNPKFTPFVEGVQRTLHA